MLLSRLKRLYEMKTLDPATRAVVADKLTYLAPKKLRRIHLALKETKEVEGDIIEFGVALGGSGIIFAQNKGDSRRYLARIIREA